MTQQERILNLAQEQIVCIGQGGTRQWGKSFKAGFKMAVKFTLENLWVSVDESLPELSEERLSEDRRCSAISEMVLIQCANGAITRARYFKIVGEFTTYGWKCVDAGFGVGSDKVTHWMPIPELPKGGEK